MFTAVLNLMMFFLTPSRRSEWFWKLPALCLSTAGFAYAFRLSVGMAPEVPVPVYLGFVSLIASPMFLTGMHVARRMVRLQQELARVASTDLLTGLDNRRAFFEKIEQLADGTILMMDVDHFKSVNDTYGHAVGDRVLVEIAHHLRASVRETDPVARIGGEEFAVFLQRADAEQVRDISLRICEGVLVTVSDGHVRLPVTLSVGIAEHEPGAPTDELLRMADEALYAAKRAGRACAVYWKEVQGGSLATA